MPRRGSGFALFLCAVLWCAYEAEAIQDEMAIGRFIPSKEPRDQIVKFRFSRGKTFVTFYESMADSAYLFPIYDMILKGQLTARPEIRDMNRDGYLDIMYKTTSEHGVLYYDSSLLKMNRTEQQNLNEREKKLTIEDELKMFDNGS
ncbi:hypothetical protein KDK77_00460 [bacterium]|nr:hypothetical protein [bacterium]